MPLISNFQSNLKGYQLTEKFYLFIFKPSKLSFVWISTGGSKSCEHSLFIATNNCCIKYI